MTMSLLIDNLKRVGWVVLVVLVGTFLDLLVHLISEKFAVPEYYFSNKIIYATLWLIPGLVVFWHVRAPLTKAMAVTGLFAVIIQTRYFLEGYPLWFVFLFMVVHFIAFSVPLYGVFRLRPNLFNIRLWEQAK